MSSAKEPVQTVQASLTTQMPLDWKEILTVLKSAPICKKSDCIADAACKTGCAQVFLGVYGSAAMNPQLNPQVSVMTHWGAEECVVSSLPLLPSLLAWNVVRSCIDTRVAVVLVLAEMLNQGIATAGCSGLQKPPLQVNHFEVDTSIPS
jgi:hypothetical protein